MLKVRLQYPMETQDKRDDIQIYTLANKEGAGEYVDEEVLVWDTYLNAWDKDLNYKLKYVAYEFVVADNTKSFHNVSFIGIPPEKQYDCCELYIPEVNNIDQGCILSQGKCGSIDCHSCVLDQRNYNLYRKCILLDDKYKDYSIVSCEECN